MSAAMPAGMHPYIAAMLELAAATARKPVSQGSVAEARASLAASREPLRSGPLGPAPDIAEVRDIAIPAPQGDIAARLYRPDGAAGIGLYLHGGGWTVGELDDFDVLARHLAAASRTALVMPAYRLAPEHPFPAGLDDAIAALRWALGGSETLGGGQPVVVMGDSAGGNLAAVAALEAGAGALAGQVLIYPACDTAMDTETYRTCDQGFPLRAADMAWFFGHYLGGRPELRGDPRVAPLRRRDLAEAPPTLIVTAEYDVLRSEAEAYAGRLAQAGVATLLETMPGVTHGALRLCNHVSTAREAIARIGDFVRQRVAAGKGQ